MPPNGKVVKSATYKRFKSSKDVDRSLKLERYSAQRNRDSNTWPRRLLHVPTMTSLERTACNTYGTTREPSYNALSYTWGRYITEGPAIQIQNVTWSIPAIEPSHFTVAEFENAISAASQNCPFLWLDIACIDQENPVIKIDEIGNQAEIFRRASAVYAWLTPWHALEMEHVMRALELSCQQGTKSSPRAYKVKATQSRSPCTLESSRDAVQTLTCQPWFTSLWTLQESHLKSDAVVLSRSSTPCSLVCTLDEGLERPLRLDWIFQTCREIFDVWSPCSEPEALTMCLSIQESGLLTLSTNNAYLLAHVSSKRKASLEEDYIYGIMQVYGFQFGIFNDISVLQHRFGQALNTLSPVYAQLFVHGTPPPPGKAWQLNRHSVLPPACYFALNCQGLCTIESRSRNKMCFDGMSCSLEDMTCLWRIACREVGDRGYSIHFSTDMCQSRPYAFLQLQDGALPKINTAARGWLHQNTRMIDMEELPAFLDRPIAGYKVLLLGRTILYDTSEGVDDLRTERHDVGVIVYQASHKRGPWVRVGICTWEDDTDQLDRSRLSEICLLSNGNYYPNYDIRIPVPETLWKRETLDLG